MSTVNDKAELMELMGFTTPRDDVFPFRGSQIPICGVSAYETMDIQKRAEGLSDEDVDAAMSLCQEIAHKCFHTLRLTEDEALAFARKLTVDEIQDLVLAVVKASVVAAEDGEESDDKDNDLGKNS